MLKPTCKLTEQNGNVFNLGGIVYGVLKRARRTEERCEGCQHRFLCWTDNNRRCFLAKEFAERMTDCHSYDEALTLMMEYVEVE